MPLPNFTPLLILTADGIASGATTVLTGNAPAGSLVVVLAVNVNANVSVSNVTDSGGNSYTKAIASVLSASYHSASLWYAPNIANALTGGTSTVTVTTSDAGNCAVFVAAVSNTNGGLDVTATANQNTTTPSLSSGALNSPVEVVFAGLNTTGTMTSFAEAPAFTHFPILNLKYDFAYAVTEVNTALTYNPSNGTSLFIASVIASFRVMPSPPATVLSYLNAFPGLPIPWQGV